MFFRIQSNPSENISLKNIYASRNDAVNALAELKRWGRIHAPCKIVEVEEPSNMFEIWQMRDDDWAHGYKFFDYKTANQLGYVAQDFYRCVYREEIDSDTKPSRCSATCLADSTARSLLIIWLHPCLYRMSSCSEMVRKQQLSMSNRSDSLR